MATEPNKVGYQIVRATEEDGERVCLFLRKHYFPYEPIDTATGLNNGTIKGEEAHLMNCLMEGISLLAVSTSNESQLLGVCINCEIHKDRNLKTLAESLKCERYAKFLHLTAFMEERSNFWKRIGESTALSAECLAVDGSLIGLGIGKVLLRETILNVTKEEGFSVFRGIGTSLYTISMSEEMELECIFSIPYNEYRNEYNHPIFNPPSPHKYAKLYIRRLK